MFTIDIEDGHEAPLEAYLCILCLFAFLSNKSKNDWTDLTQSSFRQLAWSQGTSISMLKITKNFIFVKLWKYKKKLLIETEHKENTHKHSPNLNLK